MAREEGTCYLCFWLFSNLFLIRMGGEPRQGLFLVKVVAVVGIT